MAGWGPSASLRATAHAALHQLVVGDAEADQAEALGFRAVEELAGEQVILGFRHAHEQGPDDGGVVAGGDAQADVAVGEAGALGGDGDVGQQGNRQARADGDAVDGGDDGLVQVNHVVNDVAGFLHGAGDDLGVADGLLYHLEVAAGGEGVARAGDDGYPHLGVLPQVQPHPATARCGG